MGRLSTSSVILLVFSLSLFSSISVMFFSAKRGTTILNRESVSLLDTHLDHLTDLLFKCHKVAKSLNLPPADPGLSAPKHTDVITRPIVDIALHLICEEQDWKYLEQCLLSVWNQTFIPAETILVLNSKPLDFFTDGQQNGQHAAPPLSHGVSIPFQRFPPLPGLQVHLRQGPIPPGNNREYGAMHSSGEIITFFDCDDYMHPQRIEVLYRVFKKHENIDVALHGYLETETERFFGKNTWLRSMFQESFYSSTEIENYAPCNDFNLILMQTPSFGLSSPSSRWKTEFANDPKVEPNHPSSSEKWFFPLGINLGCGNIDETGQRNFHNGWVTTRRKVLGELGGFPNLKRGEDGLFNWRAIKAGFNFTGLPWILGAYVHREAPAVNSR